MSDFHVSEKDWREVKGDVKATREKVFDGISNTPKLMWGLIILLVPALTAILTLLGSMTDRVARLEQAFTDHVDWGLEKQVSTVEAVQQIEDCVLKIQEALDDHAGND